MLNSSHDIITKQKILQWTLQTGKKINIYLFIVFGEFRLKHCRLIN